MPRGPTHPRASSHSAPRQHVWHRTLEDALRLPQEEGEQYEYKVINLRRLRREQERPGGCLSGLFCGQNIRGRRAQREDRMPEEEEEVVVEEEPAAETRASRIARRDTYSASTSTPARAARVVPKVRKKVLNLGVGGVRRAAPDAPDPPPSSPRPPPEPIARIERGRVARARERSAAARSEDGSRTVRNPSVPPRSLDVSEAKNLLRLASAIHASPPITHNSVTN